MLRGTLSNKLRVEPKTNQGKQQTSNWADNDSEQRNASPCGRLHHPNKQHLKWPQKSKQVIKRGKWPGNRADRPEAVSSCLERSPQWTWLTSKMARRSPQWREDFPGLKKLLVHVEPLEKILAMNHRSGKCQLCEYYLSFFRWLLQESHIDNHLYSDFWKTEQYSNQSLTFRTQQICSGLFSTLASTHKREESKNDTTEWVRCMVVWESSSQRSIYPMKRVDFKTIAIEGRVHLSF